MPFSFYSHSILYIRVSSLGKWLSKVENSHELNPYETPVVMGHYRNLPVITWGKNAEFDYKKSRYPRFPMGSFGHIVSRKVSEFINYNFDDLFEYQGEDTSLGIWIDESEESFKSSVKWLGCDVCVHSGHCEDKNKLLIGHHIRPAKMKVCFEKADEVEIDNLGIMMPRNRKNFPKGG